MLSVNEGLNTPYYYLDDFMFFEFDGISSSTYNIFKINSGDDLVFHNSQNSSHEYVTPSYSNRTYYLGSKSGQKEFKWKCAGEGLTLPQIREVLEWLEEGKVGTLRDDHMGTWCYDVVVDSISDFNKWVQNDGTYIVEFDIGFKHIGSVFARSYYAAMTPEVTTTTQAVPSTDIPTNNYGPESYTAKELVATNEYGIPEVVITQVENETNKYKIRIARIGDKGYSMKCKVKFTNPIGEIKVHFHLQKSGTFDDTIVEYDYTHLEHFPKRCVLEYNSNTNLLLLNNNFIEDTDDIIITPGKSTIINEFKVQTKSVPKRKEDTDMVAPGTFTAASKKRVNASLYEDNGSPSSTLYDAEICFDGVVNVDGNGYNTYFGYYDEYILTCTCTGDTSIVPSVEVIQYTIL